MPNTTLGTSRIGSASQANEVFGGYINGGETPIVLFPGGRMCTPWFVVPEGCYALVTEHGAQQDYAPGKPVWPAGYHKAPIWIQISHLITKQHIVFDVPVKGCPTKDNVSVQVDMVLVFRIMGDETKGEDPSLVTEFIYKLGANQLDQQLRNTQEEAVRGLVRSVNHDEAYTLATNSTDDMLRSMNNDFNKFGVEITSVAITNVVLPKDIGQRLEDKTTYIAVDLREQMKQKFTVASLEDNEDLERITQQGDEGEQEEQARGKKLVADILAEHRAFAAGTRKLLADIQEECKSQVMAIEADSELEVTNLVGETQAAIRAILGKGRVAAEQSKMETQALVVKAEANAQEGVAEAQARALLTIAKAEEKAKGSLAAKRLHSLRTAQLGVLEALAHNKSAVISGHNSDNMVAQVAASASASSVLSLPLPPAGGKMVR